MDKKNFWEDLNREKPAIEKYVYTIIEENDKYVFAKEKVQYVCLPGELAYRALLKPKFALESPFDFGIMREVENGVVYLDVEDDEYAAKLLQQEYSNLFLEENKRHVYVLQKLSEAVDFLTKSEVADYGK